MLGVIFTEFLELVEQRFGLAMTDRILTEAAPANGGAYTAVGHYPHTEMVALVGRLHQATGIPIADLLRTFGEHLFGRLAEQYPDMIAGVPDSLSLFATIDRHIHVQVKKLYPNAELPTFRHAQLPDGGMELTYTSKRRMADLAEGLMIGCARHMGEELRIERAGSPEDPDSVVFRIHRV
ncbi:MAG: heme NO-binding domain-containing protein [Flavobacteriales bacterium]